MCPWQLTPIYGEPKVDLQSSHWVSSSSERKVPTAKEFTSWKSANIAKQDMSFFFYQKSKCAGQRYWNEPLATSIKKTSSSRKEKIDQKTPNHRRGEWHMITDNSCVSWVFSNLGDFKYVHYNKCQNLVLKQLSTPWTTVLAKYYVLSSDCLGELSHVYFQLADFLLYDCIMINHSFELNYMMNYTSPHRKLQDPEIVFGTLVQTTQQQFIGHIVRFCRQ